MNAMGSRNLRVNEEIVECVPISEFAKAIHRSPISVRSLERSGILPRPYVIHPDDPRGRRRMYPISYVRLAQEIAERQRFGRRRPSGHDAEHARAFFEAWNRATSPKSATTSDLASRTTYPRNQMPRFNRRGRSGVRPARQLGWQTAQTLNERDRGNTFFYR